MVSGLNDDGHLDLRDVAFGAGTTVGYTANADGTGGTLSVSDGAHSGEYRTGLASTTRAGSRQAAMASWARWSTIALITSCDQDEQDRETSNRGLNLVSWLESQSLLHTECTLVC